MYYFLIYVTIGLLIELFVVVKSGGRFYDHILRVYEDALKHRNIDDKTVSELSNAKWINALKVTYAIACVLLWPIAWIKIPTIMKIFKK